MRNAFEYFDKVFLINLDKRTDRLERCMKIFEQNNVKDLVERFPGVIPNTSDNIPYTKDTEKIKIPLYGCLLSHINIIKKAKREGLKSILVLEDDIEFINIEYIDKSVDQLKKREWDLFYLGSNTHVPLYKKDSNLLVLKKGYATHAIAYHENFYDYFIENFEKRKINIIDVWLSDYGQENFKSYCTYPITAIQINDYSDIQSAHVNYTWMERKFEKNTKHLK
jgi:GR25 family glycosyltransferase involved in LPS biosynthesis